MSDHPGDFTGLAILYLVFGCGSIIFFFVGVCAILCCCRQQFRGMERKGYVVREADNAPLIMPTVSCGQESGILAGGIPSQPMPPYPPMNQPMPSYPPSNQAPYPPAQPSPYSNYQPDAPPPYGTSPAKY